MIKEENKLFNEFTEKFDELVSDDKLNINSLEDLMINNIEDYKQKLNHHVEELLKHHINEQELISKKNENGNY